MTVLRLSCCYAADIPEMGFDKQLMPVCKETPPALLASFVYLKNFLNAQHQHHYRDWVMDSGAFSAHNSGVEIDIQEYIETCKLLLANDETLTEVYALDVIGDHTASIKNCERMWEAGVEAIPCYHFGEPIDVLEHIASNYPKIAIGGCARKKGGVKLAFAQQCFAHVWPKKIHGFGFSDEKSLMSVPFHSCDATTWELGPCAFGNWHTFGKMSVNGSNQNLRSEVEWYLKLERQSQRRWKKEMAELEALP